MKATYAKKGQPPLLTVQDSKGYQHLSLSGFISESGELKYELRQGSFNGAAMRRFLQKQFKGHQKYSLIWDGASIHNSLPIKD